MLPLNEYYFKIQGVAASGGSTPSGTIEITTNGTHDVSNYANANVNVETGITPSGTLEITENGDYDVTEKAGVSVNVASSGEDMLQMRVDNSLNAGRPSCRYLFYNSTIRNVDFLINLDISRVQEMSNMFESCTNLTTIPLLNTSNVTDMQSMFRGCRQLTSIPQLDTSNVTKTNNMFNGCSNLATIPQLDTSKVTNMGSMFGNCSNLTTIPQLDTSNVTDMSYMFVGCPNLTTIPLLNTSKVTNMGSMFSGCSNLTTIPLLDMYSVNSTSSMFNNCTNLTNLTLKNIRSNLPIGSGTTYGHLLTLESLLNTCQECVNMNFSKTLTIGSANIEKLASVYVKLTNTPEEDATLPKLPMVQCESSDEGAMSVTDYMALKNWTLA